MSPPPHRPVSPAAVLATAVLATASLTACALLAACGAPPDLAEPSRQPVPGGSRSPTASPSATPGIPLPPMDPPLSPSPSGFPDSYAVDCAGEPTGTQVIRLVRRSGTLLPASSRVAVDTGPLCSGTWQYTVLSVPGRELLAVVTRGRPAALTLVTAGTDVCSIPVRVQAPAGILNAAACV